MELERESAIRLVSGKYCITQRFAANTILVVNLFALPSASEEAFGNGGGYFTDYRAYTADDYWVLRTC